MNGYQRRHNIIFRLKFMCQIDESLEPKIVTGIETDTFYSIVKYLKKSKWNLDIEYNDQLFDKGIDFDFYQFSKSSMVILFAWNNWFEGEIKGDLYLLNKLSERFDFQLKFNNPEYLDKPNLIEELKDSLKFRKK